MAEEAAAIGETHRDDVWERVQSRLSDAAPEKEPKRRRLPFSRQKEAVETPDFLRNVPKDAVPGHEDHAEMEGLMDIAKTRRYWSQLTKNAAGAGSERVWTRVSRTIIRHKGDKQEARHTWPRAAAVAAVSVALLVAALGPLPATGFADHPFIAVGRTIAEHVGMREAAPPAIPPGEPLTLARRDVTVAEATALLGVAVATPGAPEGYALQASRFFEEALTANSGGAFVLTYAGPDAASVAVYQERASGADLAIPAHSEALEGRSATDVALADGTAATYVQGAWQAANGGLTWNDTAGQALVFERGGLRTTVQYTGPQATAPSLFALADSLATSAD